MLYDSVCVVSVLPQSHFISALTVVFVNSKSLSSLKIDDTPVDDPSLKVLVANNSDTLKLLKMSSCPHVSPAGTVRDQSPVAQPALMNMGSSFIFFFQWLSNCLNQSIFKLCQC